MVLPESEDQAGFIFSEFEQIKWELADLKRQLTLTRAELQNRTGSILRMEQKIDILIRQLIELNVVKINESELAEMKWKGEFK